MARILTSGEGPLQDPETADRAVPSPCCEICGRELHRRTTSTEGGLVDRWECPLHGTRGTTAQPEPEQTVKLVRNRLIEVTEQWVRACDEFPGCHAASPGGPCCGDGHWERIGEE